MKRLIYVMFALTMLCSAAYAEDATVLSAEATCSHTFELEDAIRDEHLWCIEESGADPALFVSAKCTLCGTEAVVFDDKTLLEADPCDPADCTHRMLRVANGYVRKQSQWQSSDKFVGSEYSWGVCIDCNTDGTMYKVTYTISLEQATCEHEFLVYEETEPYFKGYESFGGVHHAYCEYYRGVCRHCQAIETVVMAGAYQPHTWEYSEDSKHIDETNRHEICYECSVCGTQSIDSMLCTGGSACDLLVSQVK